MHLRPRVSGDISLKKKKCLLNAAVTAIITVAMQMALKEPLEFKIKTNLACLQ